VVAGLLIVNACGQEGGDKIKIQEKAKVEEKSQTQTPSPDPVLVAHNDKNELDNKNNNDAECTTVSGTIFYKGPEPKQQRVDMGADAICKGMHQDPVMSESILTDKSGDNMTLRNVIVYVKKGLEGKKFETPKDAVVINQKGCMYNPHVFGMMVGQTLLIRNSDQTDHNIKSTPTKNKSFNIGQVKGSPDKEQKFSMEEIVKLECNIHGWMNSYCGVFKHPYFSVTGEKGTFEIKDLPPGEYELEAWHEKLGKKTATVKIGDKEAKTQDFTFEGK
ncbi:hypothetical protein HY605_04115, partial [Candidatus Peregrinibacteria bacterium]|nr:hypothetical protein [Candidatus Peregrinibacteria bacterium]